MTKDISYYLNNHQFQMIILPTEQCNFRCTYCYEEFLHGKMKPETVNSIKLLIAQRATDVRHLRLSWFGGEPLLALDVVKTICAFAKSIAEQYPDFHVDSDMTTNGYLLDLRTAEELIGIGISEYHISLDGHKDLHDSTRRGKKGHGGSYERIMNNLLSLHGSDLDFSVILRIHYFSDTWESTKIFARELSHVFGKDTRFKLYFKAIEPLGGPNNSSIKKISTDEQVAIAVALEASVPEPTLIYRELSQNNLCYASLPNSVVIHSDGKIGKCTVALHDERNIVGQLNTDGSLNIIQPRFRNWLKGFDSQSEADLGCPWNSIRISTRQPSQHPRSLPVVD